MSHLEHNSVVVDAKEWQVDPDSLEVVRNRQSVPHMMIVSHYNVTLFAQTNKQLLLTTATEAQRTDPPFCKTRMYNVHLCSR